MPHRHTGNNRCRLPRERAQSAAPRKHVSGIPPLLPRARRIAVISLLAILAACSTTGTPTVEPVGKGSILRLRQPLADLPNGSHVDFQQGMRIKPGNLDRWSTYCRLYVYDPTRGADYLLSLSPGSFTVTGVSMSYRSSDFPGMADNGFGLFPWGVRVAPSYYLYKVGLRISSPDQPVAHSLDCYRKWATAHADQYPTLAEIRAALGDLATIELPAIAAPPPASTSGY
jgi:hypothetical protein